MLKLEGASIPGAKSAFCTVNGAPVPAQLVTMPWTGPVAASAGACTLICAALMYSTNPALALIDTLLPSRLVGALAPLKSGPPHSRALVARLEPFTSSHDPAPNP